MYELAEDHVMLVTCARDGGQQGVDKIAGVLPLLRNILEIDNSDPLEAKILN